MFHVTKDSLEKLHHIDVEESITIHKSAKMALEAIIFTEQLMNVYGTADKCIFLQCLIYLYL